MMLLRYAVVASLTLLVGACDDAVEPPVQESAPPSDPANVNVDVNVTEGTNLAVALRGDGQQLILGIQGRLFTLPISGGEATSFIADYYDAREPHYAPDGKRIAFHGYRNGNWDLFEVELAGGNPVALTSDSFDDREAFYTPDGASIVFASDRSGNYDIWQLDRADGRLTQLTSSPVDEHSPAVSADGRLAYAANHTPAELHYQTDTGDDIVGALEAGVVNGIAWSPDGREISFQTHLRRPEPATAMKILTLADGTTRRVSRDDDDVFPFRAGWLDDGLVFAVNGGIRRQPKTGAFAQIPFDAQFTLARKGYDRKRRDHDSRKPKPALGLVRPVIAADGKTVAFTALGDLWLWRPDSKSLENLTDDPAADQMPAFSNDGTRLAYITDKGGQPKLMVYDLSSAQHTPVDVPAISLAFPSWSPNDEQIAVFVGSPTSPLAGQLNVIDLATGEFRTKYKPVPSQPTSWTPDGETIVTTALAPFSKRYREGVHQLIAVQSKSAGVIEAAVTDHENITELTMTPAGDAVTFIRAGVLWQQPISESFSPSADATALTNDLTDSPSWSAGGDVIVYMSGDKMLRLNVATSVTDDITPPLEWSRDQPTEERWVVRIGRLFDSITDNYRTDIDITVRGNRIESIAPATADTTPDVDASEYSAFAGLFEMHAHLGQVSESQGRTWLSYGVTSVRDPGSDPYTAKERQEAWDSGRRLGPRTHVTGYLLDGNRVYYAMAEGVVSEAHLELALERARALELDLIKTYVRLPDHWQKRVIEFAHGIGIPVSSHEIYPAVAHGMDHVEHIGGTSRRGYQPKVSALGYSYNDVVRLLSESGMGITPTAVLPGFAVVAKEDEFFDTPQFQRFYGPLARRGYTRLIDQIGAGAGATANANGALLRQLVAADALMVTGTDSPFVPYGAGLHAEFRLYQNAGLTPTQILRAATVKSAQAAGVITDLGTLQDGKLADIVIVNGDPLADIRDADNVVMTVKNGVLYELDELLNRTSASFGG